MSIQSEIERLNNAKTEIAEAISEKGVEVSEDTNFDEFPSLVRSIPVGNSTEEIVWVTCNLDLATISVNNISHTYQEILGFINEGKRVYIKGDFGIGFLMGAFTTYNSIQAGGVLIAQLMFTGDLGYGNMLLHCNLEMFANGNVNVTPYSIEYTKLGG